MGLRRRRTYNCFAPFAGGRVGKVRQSKADIRKWEEDLLECARKYSTRGDGQATKKTPLHKDSNLDLSALGFASDDGIGDVGGGDYGVFSFGDDNGMEDEDETTWLDDDETQGEEDEDESDEENELARMQMLFSEYAVTAKETRSMKRKVQRRLRRRRGLLSKMNLRKNWRKFIDAASSKMSIRPNPEMTKCCGCSGRRSLPVVTFHGNFPSGRRRSLHRL